MDKITAALYPETKALIKKLADDGLFPTEVGQTDAARIHYLLRIGDAYLRGGLLEKKPEYGDQRRPIGGPR